LDRSAARELLGLGNNSDSSGVHFLFMRRRIVLSTLGSLGDLHPIMGLALGLQARGHDVVLATSDFYRDKIEAAGLRFSALRPLAEPDDAMLRLVFNPRKGVEYLLRTLLLPHIGDMYEDMSRATAGADFLVSGEVVLAAPLVAEKRGLPWAAAILAPFSFFSIYDPPPFPFLPGAAALTRAPPFIQRQLLSLGRLVTGRWGEPINELRRSLGLRISEHPILLDRFSPLLNLAMFSEVLGRPQTDWPRNTVQTGFVFYDPADDTSGARLDETGSARLQAFLESGPPPVTFTLGSAAVRDPGRFFEESAATARLLGTRGLLLMGKNPPPPHLSKQLFAADYAPYSSVFPQSACVVHQGGVGTTAQALRAAVPQLVMPYAFDQPDNASRMVRMGVGRSVSRQRYRADRVVRQLQALGMPGFRARARNLASRINCENGVATACDAIERAIQSAGGI
jgi:UDP:flavonoid glycosyltransferase YjiC (YdhE family)